jgi:hypothetical protein
LWVLRDAWGFEGLGNARLAELCLAEPEFFNKLSSARDVCIALANGHMDSGLRALELLPENHREKIEFDMRVTHLAQAFRGDIGAAMDAIENAPEQLQSKLRASVFESLAEDDPSLAQQWLKAHPDYENELAWRLALRTPLLPDSSLEQIIGQQLSGNEIPKRIEAPAAELLQHYALTNPHRGANWLRGLPDHSARDGLAKDFAEKWANRDPGGASTWVQSLEPGLFRDYATLGVMRSLRYEPAQAMRLAESISNPEGRFEAIQQLVDAWKWADSQVAADLVEGAALTDTQRNELRARLERANSHGGAGQ